MRGDLKQFYVPWQACRFEDSRWNTPFMYSYRDEISLTIMATNNQMFNAGLLPSISKLHGEPL